MRKDLEQVMPASCWNKARDDETVFVLLGRDPAAPAAIRAWVEERIRLGKNKVDDEQIVEALKAAISMERGHTEQLPAQVGAHGVIMRGGRMYCLRCKRFMDRADSFRDIACEGV